jgi:hypothetical protein
MGSECMLFCHPEPAPDREVYVIPRVVLRPMGTILCHHPLSMTICFEAHPLPFLGEIP